MSDILDEESGDSEAWNEGDQVMNEENTSDEESPWVSNTFTSQIACHTLNIE